MSGRDLPRLGPQDAVVAMRSFPRRYREQFAAFEGDDTIDALAVRIGPDGESAAQIVSDVTRTWAVLGDALERILRHDGAVLHPAVADPAQRSWEAPHPEALADTLALLDHEAEAVVEVVQRVSTGSDWERTAEVAGGATVSALTVLRDAVATGAEGLTRVHAALTSAAS